MDNLNSLNADDDIKAKIAVLHELKTIIEIGQLDSVQLQELLATAIPALLTLLSKTEPTLNSAAPEQRLRISILEVFNRIPFNEHFKSYLPDLMQAILNILKSDNEENACVCLKLYLDLHKAYKTNIEEFVQPFLDIVLQIYRSMPQTVRDSFDGPKSVTAQSNSSQSPRNPVSPPATADEHVPKTLNKSMNSYKVLTECPIIIVLLFSNYRPSVQSNLQNFTPAIIEMLSLQAAPQLEQHKLCEKQGKSAVGLCPDLRNKPAYGDFILAQIKTLSFLAYVLRGFTNAMRKYQPVVPQYVVRLLQDCPPEMSAARKELLVATRHILSTDFRNSFVDKIELLLDQEVLVGVGVTSHETLRPLAFSMLADMIHHVRAELGSSQIKMTIDVYARNLLDTTLTSSIQTMSAKLLLNMIDRIMKLPDQRESRILLLMILSSFTAKFKQMNERGSKDGSGSSPTVDFHQMIRESGIQIGVSTVSEVEPDQSKDSRFLFKNLMIGLKTILFGLKSCNPPLPPTVTLINAQQWGEVVRGLDCSDLQLFANLFREGVQGFSLYRCATDGERNKAPEKSALIDAHLGFLTPNSRDEKDVLETFATVFIHIDPASFQEIFDQVMDKFYEQILENGTLLHIPQFFLTNDSTSPNFAGLLLNFLVNRMDQLGSSNTIQSSVLLRLFKLSFMAVTMFPDLNEVILQPHLAHIIIQSMKMSAKAENPINYYILLRALFRSIGGGRFELLYKEVLPLLQVLLESLNTLLQSARKQQEKELYVELCLTVPVRLSVLLPYLNYLMRPLVIALDAGPDLVTQGLRTLELCIDNLTQEFLDPILAPVLDELMQALWAHLKPLPHNHLHSHSALRILGKMGGRNRKFLDEPQRFKFENFCEDQATLEISFHSSDRLHPLRWTKFIPLAIRALTDEKVAPSYKLEAFTYLESTIRLFIGHTEYPEQFGTTLRALADAVVEESAEMSSSTGSEPQLRLVNKVRAQEATVKQALLGAFDAVAVPALKDKASIFLKEICSHFAILELAQAREEISSKKRSFAVEAQETLLHLDTHLFLQVLVDAMCSEIEEVREAVTLVVKQLFTFCEILLGGSDKMASLPVFNILVSKFCHCCYEDWCRKTGGTLGISIIVKQISLGKKWLLDHQLELVRALLYVIKDTPAEIPSACVMQAINLLQHIIRECNSEEAESILTLNAVLISELSNPNSLVRETTQDLFKLLSELTDSEVQDILKPVQDRLLTPIFTKPLRALPFAMQIGHIDAVTFCLALQPTFLEYNDELFRLLHEALALADADDDALVNVNRTSQYKSSSALVTLRIVCIKLLTIAVSSPEFAATAQAQSRGRIIAVFFKSLYSKSIDVVDVANKGLKQVLSQNHKLPKDLLQAGLRPILMNLSDHKRLTVPGLEGLARLLELLTNYFKVEIGKKLLDHLRAWAEPATLQQISAKPLKEQQCIKVIAAILNIFHLLPPSAHMFLDELVVAVTSLEDQLRRTTNSPLRPPLLRFVNRYPQETWDYFKGKLNQSKLARFFTQLVDDNDSVALRKTLQLEMTNILSSAKIDEAIPITTIIDLSSRLSKHKSQDIRLPKILRRLLALTADLQSSHMNEKSTSLALEVGGISERLSTMFVDSMTESDDDDLLLDLIRAISSGHLQYSSLLDQYILNNILFKAQINRKQAIFIKSVRIFGLENESESFKIMLFRHIINPLLLSANIEETVHKDIVDKSLIEAIHNNVWKVALNDFGEDVVCSSDALRIETLHMSTLLIRKHANLVSEVRKDVIKFGWNYIKLDDLTTKHAAYVFIAYFIAAYDTPSKISAQIYVALLRAAQPEARSLVKQALGAMSHVLGSRIPSSDSKVPGWVKYPRKVITEESNAMQLITVLQFIVHHPGLFSVCKNQFVSQIVSSLPKLCFPQNATQESKSTAIDLAELVFNWSKEAESDGEDRVMNDVDDNPEQKVVTLTMKESIISFLLRFVMLPSDNPRKVLAVRAISLMKDILEFHPEMTRDVLAALEKPLSEIDEKNIAPTVHALEILSFFFQNQSKEWLLTNLEKISTWLDKSLKSDHLSVQVALQPALRCVLSSLPKVKDEEESSAASDLKSKVVTMVNDNFQNSTNMPVASLVLESISESLEDSIDALVPVLMKVFQKLVKDHITLTAPSVEHEGPNKTILTIMDVICKRMLYLGDQRRYFLSAMAQLIEKSPYLDLCRRILTIVKEWVLEKRDSFPTIKEKTSLLMKMISFEGRWEGTLANDFLRLIIAIYEDPTIARTELTVRLEHAFLMGTRAPNFDIRNEFMKIFNASMTRSLHTRLNYVFAVQNWESLSNHYWIHQANHLLIGSVNLDNSISLTKGSFLLRNTKSIQVIGKNDEIVDDQLEELVQSHKSFIIKSSKVKAKQILSPMVQLQHLEFVFGEYLWCEIFPLAWSSVNKKDRSEVSRTITIQLSKEYHLRQIDKRPNVIQALLAGLTLCTPAVSLPPHLVKYLGRTFNAWYLALAILERAVDEDRSVPEANLALKESTLDALTETYASLSEDDMFYGLWRRRCQYLESNAAISFEQNGMWDKAQQMYETAQIKARTGVLPFSESEYTLWEDHWILCAQKLQQWDVLTDLAKQEGYSDLLLECAWRVSDWTTDREPLETSIKSLMDVPTPRRYTFEAFMALQKTQAKLESPQEFQRICDEGMQLSLRKWYQLPNTVSGTHVPLLQSFQQSVEMQEASQIYKSLAETHAQNLETKSHELKHILQTWRERLPNFHDDINGWSDLVAWRQLIFSSINRVYLPLVPALQQPAGPNANSNATSFAYRGYHETAWIINRFAHVARKHQLPEVCINQLTKIYTLPNIEIQEAFLKLREQAKCHYQNPNELGQGLEVISNTNLMYFGTQQKAEFFTLKGMFLAKLKLNDEANQAFATAIQIDLTLPKAWAEWGQYSDRLFQENASELTSAGNAVSCYLQAAGLFKNGRARKMLSRILWLLSLDDAQGTISVAFESYKGEVPTWYWITFIPQLLTSLSHKEARHARQILIRIAKTYPQALHFQLRTTKEDYAVIKKQAIAAAQNANPQRNPATDAAAAQAKPSQAASSPNATTDKTALGEEPRANSQPRASQGNSNSPALSMNGTSNNPTENATQSAQSTVQNRQPWEHVDEIMAILKTAYPLLALSMETMVDQIQQRFKCQADEDAYRLIVALLNDGVQYIGRLVAVTEETKLPPATQANITRFAESVLPKNIKAAFEKEFVQEKPHLQEYVSKLRKWRDRFEIILDQRPQTQQLEQVSPYLSEFQYQKFDEVEIPGQYLHHRDNSNDFVRIDRFMPTLDVVRGHGICYRRVTIRGHDGSFHQFAIQYPAARHCRREERIIQLFRILSGVLARRKESRKRNLQFHLPAAIPLAPHIRIVQDDSSYVSLQGIYEDYCARTSQHKDAPLKLATERIQALPDIQNDKAALLKTKVEILEVIQDKLVPDTIVLDFFKQTFPSFSEFWRFRKQFSLQYASLTFMTYAMNINNRFPHKLFISKKSGQVWGTELLPGMAPNNPVFYNGESVPFRFTPTIQALIGPISIEGVFSCAVMAIGRCLTEPEFELDQHLSVFVRDELITWFTQQHRPVTQDTQLRDRVASNVDLIVRRATSLSHVAQGNLPANQTMIDLIAQAVNPQNLAQMDQLWLAFC